ncbi:growth factor receptor-bound protein 10-like isoform X6 [Vespa velutina]|uniref:growth factor receptor-bound protein 10-like isoform X6 n=1 Tax=Vespa velutina TaxID=202808 RepID=UPI001FB50CF3|nr:growth factor receptor-bound protein 10-like isoform X6 [Vespa velutina]
MRVEKMCSCLDGGSTITGGRSAARAGSYERLGSAPTIFEISSMMQRARRRIGHCEEDVLDSERQEELRFYNDDQTWTAVVVEKNLRTIDLCELLKVKRNVSGIAWSIVETWPELGFERTLEDHEDILAVHREMEMFAPHHERKFYFRQDFLKYEFFINPKQFFPTDMVAFPHDEDRGTFSEVESALRNYLSREDGECPQVFSSVWMRDELLNTWRKTYMLLRERKLYTTKKTNGTFPKRPSENDQLNPLAHLSDYHIYRIPNARRCFNAPFEWGACLRPRSNAEAEDTEGGEHGLKVIAFHSEKARACWLTAMRLAKYGKQLRENYRAFKNKQCEQSSGGSPKEQYSSYNVTNIDRRTSSQDLRNVVSNLQRDSSIMQSVTIYFSVISLSSFYLFIYFFFFVFVCLPVRYFFSPLCFSFFFFSFFFFLHFVSFTTTTTTTTISFFFYHTIVSQRVRHYYRTFFSRKTMKNNGDKSFYLGINKTNILDMINVP